MSLATQINRPCRIVRRSESGSTDDYGNDIPTETEVETVWELQQRRRDEAEDQGEVSETDWIAYFLAGEILDTGDAVIDTETGHEYELIGEPWEARNLRTRVFHHIEATVRRTAGAEDAS